MERKKNIAAVDPGCSHCDPGIELIKNDVENFQSGKQEHNPGDKPSMDWLAHWNLLAALLILASMMVLKYGFIIVPSTIIDFSIHLIAYLLAGYNVLNLAFRRMKRGDFFNEFVLMSVATVGAFYIGAFSEGVAVMVFYCIGEWFQDAAVSKAKRNIKALLDIRPHEVTVERNGQQQTIHPDEVVLGEKIMVRNGERIAIDGTLISEKASLNAAALTGESVPVSKRKTDQVYAGMVNMNQVIEIKVNALFKDSALSRILEMVQTASARKSQTQLFISKFAKVYTPIVFFLAMALCIVPYFFVEVYFFREWFYKALVFLVVSCPCALVISIPLGYFGGIGLASRNGILFKGGNFLDAITQVNTVVMDKTGTLTKGVFKVQKVVSENLPEEKLISIVAQLEKNSTHPIAKAIIEYNKNISTGTIANDVEEVAGMGLKGMVNGDEVLAGNIKLLDKFNIAFPSFLKEETDTIVVTAINKKYEGCIVISDEIKTDAPAAIKQLHQLNIETVMFSGDKQSVVDQVAKTLHIDQAYGDLLPRGKLDRLYELKNNARKIAFAGDGINDAPSIALADVGIAMGALGSHAAIETADVVIQTDQPSKIVTAIKIGKITRQIVWQNIIIAMVVKIAVLLLGASGIATLWEAVIADVGVALFAILNAVRIQHKQL